MGIKIHVKFMLPILHDAYYKISFQLSRRKNKIFKQFPPVSYFVQAGTQISLADLSFSDETCTLWYNLLPCRQIASKKNKEQNEESMFLLSKRASDLLDLVSDVLTITVIARKTP